MRDTIERQQAWIYLTAILVGMAMGYTLPKTAASWEILIWPLMAGLLYATFTQVPFANMAIALRDKRFLAALLVGNFIVMPVISGVLLLLLPDNAAIKLGVLLVLLVPCTDWFISFAHLGRGDAARERLRRGRPQLVADRPGQLSRARQGRGACDPLRRQPRA